VKKLRLVTICLGIASGLFLASGCGTIQSIKLDNRTEPTKDIHVLYGGVHYDCQMMDPPSSGGWELPPSYCFFPFALIDLPLSFVADTVMLPYTIPRANHRKQEIAKKVVDRNWQIYQYNRSQMTNQPPYQPK
jgi:uncharacterized protein YceK